MFVTPNPLPLWAAPTRVRATPSEQPGNISLPGGIGGIAVLRYSGTADVDSLKLSGALTADDLLPGAALGAAATLDGKLEQMQPFGAKARLELSTQQSPPSPALAGYLQLLEQNGEAIGKLQSNVDPTQFDSPEKVIEFIRSLKSDEFVLGAAAGENLVLWRGSLDKLPAGVADVVRGSDKLFGTLA